MSWARVTARSVGDPVLGLLGSGWYGLTGYAGSGDRTRGAVAGELRVPLGEHVVVNLAGRVDEYDSNSTSFGSGFTPSVSLEWRPFRPVLLRAGYAESFRAPDLVQVFSGSGFFTQATDYIRCFDTYNILNSVSCRTGSGCIGGGTPTRPAMQGLGDFFAGGDSPILPANAGG